MVNYWDKYTKMHGQQNDKYTEMHGQQNDKYTKMHGQQNVKILHFIDRASYYFVNNQLDAQVFFWTPHGHLQTVTYTSDRTDTNDSPDDEHMFARNI